MVERVGSLYKEQASGQLVARHVYIDFRENFGNFASCFQGSNAAQEDLAQIKSYGEQNLWAGGGIDQITTE